MFESECLMVTLSKHVNHGSVIVTLSKALSSLQRFGLVGATFQQAGVGSIPSEVWENSLPLMPSHSAMPSLTSAIPWRYGAFR